MATSASDIVDDALRVIALSGNATARAAVERYAEEVAQDVWNEFPWHERKKEYFVNTVAPYTTGTVTATEGSTTVSGTDTTFTESMVGRKFALSLDDPYYVIDAFVSATEVTLDRAYVETTATDSAYTIYDDILTLVHMDGLISGSVVLFANGYDYPLDDLTSQGWDAVGHLPRSEGHPTAFRMVEDGSVDSTRIQVWPSPDDAYAVRYICLQTYTNISQILEKRRDIVTAGTTARALRYIKKFSLAEAEEARYERMLRKAVTREKRLFPMSVVLRPFDQPLVRGGRTGRFYWKP